MKKKWICLLTALALVAGVCAVKPVISGAAPSDPVDLEEPCSLKVRPADLPASQKYWEDMKTAPITVDLYQIAAAEAVSGYDTYGFAPKEGYEALAYEGLKISEYSDLQKIKAAGWESLAQQAAAIALDEQNPVHAVKTGELKEEGADFEGLGAGLYLIVARGSNLSLSEYKTTMERKVVEDNTEKTVTELVTIANSDRYTYSFTPQLIALPTKPAVDGSINTANQGDWLYEADTILKSGREQRYGSLEIRKTLTSYETEPGKEKQVTFVFHITGTLNGTLDNEETLTVDKYESITFTGAGQESVIVEKLPAAMEVTIEEIYTGAVYEPDNTGTYPRTQTLTIRAGQTETVAAVVDFENKYREGENPGSGIKNTFTYENGTWVWSSSPKQPDGQENE